MRYIIVILLMAISIRAYTIHNLSDKKYVLIHTTDTFTFNETRFLYHIFDLESLLRPYESVLRTSYQMTVEDEVLINRIKTLYEQLERRKVTRAKRSLDFLGTALSWLTGVPDHDDLIEIKQTLNDLIENNNQQRVINERFNSLLTDPMTPFNTRGSSVILSETLHKLQVILETINLAKNQQFFSQSLDLDNLEEVMKNEKNTEISLLDILEYADISVCRFGKKIIIIYKYPIIIRKCKHFKIIPLAFRHGKIQMDNEIMKCDEQFIRTKNCKNNFEYNICRMDVDDNCTTSVINNVPSTCNVLQENNEKTQFPGDGYIILDGTYEVNNESIRGINLIEFENNITIDGKLYVNHGEELKQVIKSRHDDDIEINEILESNKQNKFTNIQSLKKYTIPFETHPIRTTCHILVSIISITLVIFLILKIFKAYNEFKIRRNVQKQQELYERALKIRGIEHVVNI